MQYEQRLKLIYPYLLGECLGENWNQILQGTFGIELASMLWGASLFRCLG